MKDRIKYIRAYLNDSTIDIRERLFSLIAAVSLVGILLAAVAGIIIGENFSSIMFTFGEFVFFLILVAVGFRFKKIIAVSYIVTLFLIFGFMPLSFFTSGGIHGGAIAWSVFDTVYIVLITRGKARVIFLTLEAIATGTVFVLYVAVPSMVVPHTEETAFADSVGSFILVSILTIIMLSFQMSLYRRENERMLEQRDEIDELNQAQNRFFSNMSHEIRTPINTIIGLNEMILRENISQEIAEDAEHIESASKMLLHLINDILDMSKFNSGQMKLVPVAFYTGDMIKDVVEMIWVRAREKGLQFQVDVSPTLPEEFMGDEMRIKQILINVLNNAVKYTKSGSVTLTVTNTTEDERNEKLIFSVADTGMGIRKESIPYLFDAFKRVDEEKNAMIEGTGLGLSIVKQFVDLMGGQISVNSVYTKGSTFTIEIPGRRIGNRNIGEMNANRKQGENRPEYKVAFKAPHASVLVVDDTPANLLVVQKLLRETEVHVDTVGSAAEALEKTMETRYNVVFMDHLMPEIDGVECMHAIQGQTGGQSKDARIVALTANAGDDASTLYAREGFDGYLVKPITGRALENELIRLLPRELVTITDEGRDLEEKSSLWRDIHEMKAMVAITTDSLVALPQHVIDEHDIAVMPCKIETANGVFRDGVDITTEGLVTYINENEIQPEVRGAETEEYVEFFASRLREARTVIHISTSSLIAEQTYRAAEEAAKSFNDVMIIDSGHSSGALGLMVMQVARLAEAGVSPSHIRDAVKLMGERLVSGLVVGDLDYMIRRGRFNKTIGNVVNSLMLRPVLSVRNGRFRMAHMYLGSDHRVWRRNILHCLKKVEKLDTSMLIVAYVGLELHEREWIREQIEAIASFGEVCFLQQPPSVAISCGPGSVAVIGMKKESSMNRIDF
ncbi:MAG: DegV family EDD domain-containing protein [Eubacterium sp.]|nr:DegV family EDD domain-containing protein [Eubacterium sp.]